MPTIPTWPEINKNAPVAYYIGVIIFLFTCWFVIVQAVSECRKEIAVGEAIVTDCDYIYLEGESPRYLLNDKLIPFDKETRNYENLRKNLENVNAIIFAIYIAVCAQIVVQVILHIFDWSDYNLAWVVVALLWIIILPAYFRSDVNDHKVPNNGLIYFLVFIGVLAMTGSIVYQISVPDHDAMRTKLIVSLVFFVFVSMFNAVSTYFVPSIVNEAKKYKTITDDDAKDENKVANYDDVKDETNLCALYKTLSQDAFDNIICKEVRRNHFAKHDNTDDVDTYCKDKNETSQTVNIVKYLEHRQGNEFKDLEHKMGNMSVSDKSVLDKIRASMQDLRDNHNKGVETMKSFYAWVVGATIVGSIALTVLLAFLLANAQDAAVGWIATITPYVFAACVIALIAFTLAVWGYAAVFNGGGDL